MAARGRAILHGFLVWLAAFVIAFLIFPFRESSRPLFESIMPVVVASATAVLAVVYFRRVRKGFVREGILLGCLWLAINVVMDLPLMLTAGPMQMTVWQYFGDIGLTYLIIPAVTIAIGFSCEQVAAFQQPLTADAPASK